MKTYNAAMNEVQRNWCVIDADGQVLGRLASEVARRLRGKHKPVFTPHTDTGDFVIVVNADKVRLTGRKWDDKKYYRHSGYPGGIRELTARELMEKYPDRMIAYAVKGMLPKNSLGRKMLTKLKIYCGNDHPHAAQMPEKLEL